MKTHKLTVKWKIFDAYTTEQAKKMFQKISVAEIKMKIKDPEKFIFITAYLTDISLEQMDDIESIIENTDLPRRKKNEIYYILKKRDDDRQRITEGIIQNVIDEVIKLDK